MQKLHHKIIRNTRIKIISTEMVVSGCGKHFDQIVTDFNDWDIESSATQIIN